MLIQIYSNNIEKISYKILKLVKLERLDKRLLDFDLVKLSDAIKIRRDLKFKYLEFKY